MREFPCAFDAVPLRLELEQRVSQDADIVLTVYSDTCCRTWDQNNITLLTQCPFNGGVSGKTVRTM